MPACPRVMSSARIRAGSSAPQGAAVALLFRSARPAVADSRRIQVPSRRRWTRRWRPMSPRRPRSSTPAPTRSRPASRRARSRRARVAVLRGKVLDRDGTAAAGRHDQRPRPSRVRPDAQPRRRHVRPRRQRRRPAHRELREGRLPAAQRAVVAPWQDYAWLPDVVLIPLDTAVTTVDLSVAAMQVARGSPVSDADGARQATLLFPQGTTATMVLPDGTTQPLTHAQRARHRIHGWAERPQAMPARCRRAAATPTPWS